MSWVRRNAKKYGFRENHSLHLFPFSRNSFEWALRSSIDTSYSAVERAEYDVFESKQTKNRKKKFILALITNVLEIDVVLFYYAAIEWWYGARESSLQRIDKEAASVRGYNRLRWERDDKENLRAINSDSEKEVLRINIEEEEEEDEDEEGNTGDEVVEGECKY
ncbi:hypothetical protein V1477_005761 [Vespula maculifrons]|uniref:Uncharacterized protein n=1 Tax=Vespula maculifrons TaxID=7453 RepID=A0ABD2CMV1_VESMC